MVTSDSSGLHVLLFYEHVARELDEVQRVASILREHGHNAGVYSFSFEKARALRETRQRPADVIVLPSLRTVSVEQWFQPFQELNHDLRVIDLHHEELSSPRDFRLLVPSSSEFARQQAFHCVWGDHFAESLTVAGVSKERIYVTGNGRSDFGVSRPADSGKSGFSVRFGLDPDKIWVLFAENRGWFEGRNLSKILAEFEEYGYDRTAVIDRIAEDRRSLDGFVSEMQNLPCAFFDQFEFIYRPHPGTSLSLSLPEQVSVIQQGSIYDWIGCCDVFLTCESTSIFEAELCDKPCFHHNPLDKGDDDVMAGITDYPELRRMSDLSPKLIQEAVRSRPERPVYTSYIGDVDGGACRRIAGVIESVMDVPNPDPSIFLGKSRAAWSRIQLYEAATRIVSSVGLLEVIKFPRSAFLARTDVPGKRERSGRVTAIS